MPSAAQSNDISQVELIVGMEIHVELATRRKMFSGAPNPAWDIGDDDEQRHPPNSCIDPTVLGLPGALPMMNCRAVELSMLVGLALGCRVLEHTHWDRKSYFYPDLPKAYQISQYDQPLCTDGKVEVPSLDADGFIDLTGPTRTVRIERAHLEEDAGKLLHELPAHHALPADRSAIDWNRAGVPLLEIVSAPDLRSADEAVSYGRLVRDICRWLRASHGVMQRGHMRFEPNINCRLTLSDGRTVVTPIVEIKNLNSFKALREAILFEHKEQPKRWAIDGREMAPGMKRTRGWDDHGLRTVEQREKEDAHEYRYFPDPDLPKVVVDKAWRDRIAAELVELPLARLRRILDRDALGVREAQAMVSERATSDWAEATVAAAVALGVPPRDAGKAASQLVLQVGSRIANERGLAHAGVETLGVSPEQAGELVAMRTGGDLSAQAMNDLFEHLTTTEHTNSEPRKLASSLGLLTVRDQAAIDSWCAAAIEADPQTAEQIRAGNDKAIGRLIGQAMQRSGGAGDAKAIRDKLLQILQGE